MKHAAAVGVLICALACVQSASAGSDPYCTGSYAAAPRTAPAKLRFGIDPGLAGSAGPEQLPAAPDDPKRDLAALRALKPAYRVLVLRLNRLFWSDGAAGIAKFKRAAATDAREGFDVEIQVRYHPSSGNAGNLKAWRRYVKQVVDAFGPDSHVVAMTITNEVNVTFSPNTSDGSYSGARDALIEGIETAHAEAIAHHWGRLRFGFTYAYRFNPRQDAAFFSYLGSHGGRAFRRALGFVGLDFYPGTIYPPTMSPGDTYTHEFAQAAGVLRDCLAPKGRIPLRVPIWITENGVPTGSNSDATQASALEQLVRAASAYAGTDNITDYRWFNLRDSNSTSPATLVGPTFSSDGLLRSDYTRKPSFAAYRRLIAALDVRG